MAMKKAYEFRINGEDIVKIRIVAIARPGEYRDGFQKRAKAGAEAVARALRDHYGELEVKEV